MPFGHHAATLGGAHVDAWGHGPLLLRYHGREWWFEFSDMFGPLVLRKSDFQPAARQPVDSTDPFWDAFNAWTRAGRKFRPIRSRRAPISGTPPRVKFYLCHADRSEVLA